MGVATTLLAKCCVVGEDFKGLNVTRAVLRGDMIEATRVLREMKSPQRWAIGAIVKKTKPT
jgi:hypothetical protein